MSHASQRKAGEERKRTLGNVVTRQPHPITTLPLALFTALLAFWLCLSAVRPAAAQSFGPPVQTELLLEFFDREGNVRFTLAAYLANWKNPYQVRVRAFSPALNSLGLNPIVTGQFRLISKATSSALFEGSYSLDSRWSVGFWYNPVQDSSEQKVVQIADVILGFDSERDADLADLHFTYRGSRGLSGQVGYYYESARIRVRTSDLQALPNIETQRHSYRLGSLNAWVTQRLDVRAGRLLLTPFVSAGKHTSSQLRRAWSAMAGAGVTVNERLSLSGSVWWFDLDDPATRVTAGLEYRF
jgi:hypothetical protein